MSGALALFAGAAVGAANGAWTLDLQDISISTPGVRTVSFTLQTDGTATCVGAGSAPDWYVPIVAGIGSGWSVRLAISSAMDTTTGGPAVEVWHGLGTSKTFSFSNSSTHAEGFGSATVELSPDDGFSIAATCIITWNVGYRA